MIRQRRTRIVASVGPASRAPAMVLALAQAGVAVELLVPAGMDLRSTALPLARMPPGSSESDTDELALALRARFGETCATRAYGDTGPISERAAARQAGRRADRQRPKPNARPPDRCWRRPGNPGRRHR